MEEEENKEVSKESKINLEEVQECILEKIKVTYSRIRIIPLYNIGPYWRFRVNFYEETKLTWLPKLKIFKSCFVIAYIGKKVNLVSIDGEKYENAV